MAERQHRSLKSKNEAPSLPSSTIEMDVEAITAKTVTLSSKQTGIIKWPVAGFSKKIKAGDKVKLTLGTPPVQKEQPDIQDLRQLLQELVG
jgi:hypothetical protein